MEKVVRNVADLGTADREVLEHLTGRHLAEHQQVIISVVDLPRLEQPATPVPSQSLEDWTHIYDGLSDEEIEAIDQVVRSGIRRLASRRKNHD